jgi:hypothetical protein
MSSHVAVHNTNSIQVSSSQSGDITWLSIHFYDYKSVSDKERFEIVVFFPKEMKSKLDRIAEAITDIMNERTPEEIYDTVDNEKEFRKKLEEKDTIFLSDS